MYDIGWKPVHYVVAPGSSISSVLVPAGTEKAVGVITASANKDPVDPQWDDDPGMREYRAFMQRYYPEGDAKDIANAVGYNQALLMAHVLRQCGDALTRDNVMRHAASLSEVRLPLLLPGASISTGPDDYRPIKTLQMRRFDGQRYVPISGLLRLGSQQ